MKVAHRSCLRRVLVVFFLLSLVAFAANKGPAPTVTLALDASEAPRKIFHARLTIVTKPGVLTLYYPKWIPGEHGPTGPIQGLTGLHFRAHGQELKWRRDLLDGWTFHVEVPPGVASVDASLDYVAASGLEGEGVYTGGASATDKMAVISWNTLLLYPEGWTSDELQYEASLRLPAGWKFATSLAVAAQTGAQIKFAPVSLAMLVDGPILTGQYLRVVPLAADPPTEMDIGADSQAALEAPAEVFDHYRQLVEQAQRLFGAHHYHDYHFLYSLSDHLAHFGLEHHESDDSRVAERGLVDDEERRLFAGLLPHEYVHSWNGKYRRPADLATSDYEKPMETDLLWVYEGLTSYLGDVLTARSGLLRADEFRDSLASIAATLDHVPGRSWRDLQDTADGVPAMQGSPRHWQSWRRDLDYYDEDVLNWLAVDMIIRQQTSQRRSLDDFCKLFYGGQSTGAIVRPYTFDDVVNVLSQVAPYNWRGFWTERLGTHTGEGLLDGIQASGWRLVYDQYPSELWKAVEMEHKTTGAGAFSLGLWLREDGTVVDTIEGMPAARSGVSPGTKLVAVNGRAFSSTVLRDALKEDKNNHEPLELLIENTGYYKTYKLDYHGGERYPHLVRDETKADLLSDIIKPH